MATPGGMPIGISVGPVWSQGLGGMGRGEPHFSTSTPKIQMKEPGCGHAGRDDPTGMWRLSGWGGSGWAWIGDPSGMGPLLSTSTPNQGGKSLGSAGTGICTRNRDGGPSLPRGAPDWDEPTPGGTPQAGMLRLQLGSEPEFLPRSSRSLQGREEEEEGFGAGRRRRKFQGAGRVREEEEGSGSEEKEEDEEEERLGHSEEDDEDEGLGTKRRIGEQGRI